MRRQAQWLFISLAILVLAALACGPTVPLPELDLPEVTIPPAAIETAEAAAGQVGGLAGTAAAVATAQGPAALATLQAAAGQVGLDTDVLREKFAGALPDTNGSATVTVTAQDVNRVIALNMLVTGGQSLLINPTVTFSGGSIVLTGQVTDPIGAQLAVTFRPYVEDGSLRFEVLGATLADRQVPAAILSGAEAALNNSLGRAVANLPANIQLQQIVMGEGTMTFLGQISN
jgi:hypothetical protein